MMEQNKILGAACARTLIESGEYRREVCGGQALRRLRAAFQDLEAVYDAISQREFRELPQALEWLADNRYLLRREEAALSVALQELPSKPFVKPYLLALSEAWMTEGYLAGIHPSFETVFAFFQEAGESAPLMEAEIAALPLILRLAAVLFLTAPQKELLQAAEAGKQMDRDAAAKLSDRMAFGFAMLRVVTFGQLETMLPSLSIIEKIYARDPAGCYPEMHEETRAAYRAETARLARRAGIPERRAAERILELAELGGSSRERHVGVYLYEKPLGHTPRHADRKWYFTAVIVIPLLCAVLLGGLSRSIWVGTISYLPIFAFLRQVIDRITLRFTRHHPLPRMTEDTPLADPTLCVLTVLLTAPEDAVRYVEQLDLYRRAAGNVGDQMTFGLLADLKEGNQQELPEDQEIYDTARQEIERLNMEWGGGFVLLLRNREPIPRENRWRGRERKRGAIEDLVRLLTRQKTGLYAAEGGLPENCRWVITLDADTEPDIGALRGLTAAMAHPLNQPILDTTRRIVCAGHGILHPRMELGLRDYPRSEFSTVYGGPGGRDPYGAGMPELSQDLFGTSNFTGKGIFDVSVYAAVLENRFPENAILSHDLLEGAYLRAGYAGELAFSDRFPGSVRSFYAREHRWIRGDWQLLPWLFSRVRTAEDREKNPLDAFAKWRIVENLRRSLTPLFQLLLWLTAAWRGDLLLFLLAAGISAAPFLFIAGQKRQRQERYFSELQPPVKLTLRRVLFDFAWLPYSAWIGFNGAMTALWRMIVTHRGLLEWTTAAESENTADTSLAYYHRMWANLLLTALLLAAPYYGVLRAAIVILGAAVWAAGPYLARQVSRARHMETSALSSTDQDWLREKAGEMLGYFLDHVTAENCWLPPDNLQVQPAVGVARRTSPTNIGLCMLSFLAAADLKLLSQEAVMDRLELTAATLERMEKWRGNLYNWYTTKDASAMAPRWVSTVDSGNLAACLVALEQGLREMGNSRADRLAERIRQLWEQMELQPLYDPNRRLFHLGWDVEHDRPAAGYYDLLASEARLTSYLAVAQGEVPPRHWSSLGRTLLEKDGYRGLSSWSGTMFEYLMPPLLLPGIPGSLLYESERFALACQKQAAPQGMPYGSSESGFFAFDSDMNYQYKAHGVQTLGFKRGLGKETVLAPYAAYLALLVDPANAVENLRRYHDLDMSGQYGYFEALDLTRPRVPEGCTAMPVRSYMAHHLGMSILAITNVLTEQVMVCRFLRNRQMAAFQGLLMERIPMGAISLRENGEEREAPERKLPSPETVLYEGAGYDAWCPECIMLSNGSYRTFVTDTGLNRTLCGMRDLTRFDGRQVGGAPGILFFVKEGERLRSLTPAPFFDEDAEYAVRFEAARAEHRMRCGALSTAIDTLVCPDDLAGIRRVHLKNLGDTPLSTTLICYLEPALDTMQAMSAHPAFSRLFLRAEPQLDGGLISRYGRDGGSSFSYLACDGVIGGCCNTRERALGRSGYGGLLQQAEPTTDGAPDPCLALYLPVELRPGGEQVITFALAYGQEPESARQAARRALHLNRGSAAHRLTELIAMLPLTPGAAASAFRLYRDALFLTPQRREQAEAMERNQLNREILWKFGVSGDFPIVTLRLHELPEGEADQLLAQHMLLYCSGAYLDLLILTSDGGDYQRPGHSRILEILRSWGGESLIGTRGGVHLIDETTLTAEEANALRAFSGVFLDRGNAERPAAQPSASVRILPENREPIAWSAEPELTWEDSGVTFRGLPALTWSHPLANRNFGYLATDAGTGYLWYMNARENKLTPWVNDPLTVSGPETLELCTSTGTYSLFARDTDSRVHFAPGMACWERKLPGLESKLTAYVHPWFSARVMLLEVRGAQAAHAKLRWYTSLQLQERPDGQVTTVFSAQRRVLYAVNGANRLYAPYVFAFTSAPAPERFTCDETDYRSGEMRYKTGAGLLPCMAAELPLRRDGEVYRAVIVCGCAANEPGFSLLTELADPEAAQKGLEITLAYWRRLAGGVQVTTPDARFDRYVNGMNAYQVIAGRLFARTSMYQSSGAYGFRDQLQDAMALLALPPEEERQRLVKVQLIRAAAHQYREGDVQHWWHPDRRHDRRISERGVRTRMTDDLLFLPFVAMEYLRVTGDRTLFDLRIPYLREPELEPDRAERFGTPEKTTDSPESLWMHCVRAADCFHRRGVGSSGLALMGGGDWNDAMNRVGEDGRGESVWLTWFGAMVLRRLAEEARVRGDETHALDWESFADSLIRAAYRAWDGKWFLRGRYDNGAPLGAAESDACRIDAISQAFAPLADPHPEDRLRADRQKIALDAAAAILWGNGPVVRLFTPPFTRESREDPGYIKAYPPGVRENGGQYTHGAIWLAMGLMRAGMEEKGSAMLLSLLPSQRGARYLTEPYYLAADVYAADGMLGRGGWSIYTGAAGWYLQAALQDLLGLRFARRRLYLSPCLPETWDQVKLLLELEEGRVELTLHRGGKPGLSVNQKPQAYLELPKNGETICAELRF